MAFTEADKQKMDNAAAGAQNALMGMDDLDDETLRKLGTGGETMSVTPGTSASDVSCLSSQIATTKGVEGRENTFSTQEDDSRQDVGVFQGT